jgi:hypothetical protein
LHATTWNARWGYGLAFRKRTNSVVHFKIKISSLIFFFIKSWTINHNIINFLSIKNLLFVVSVVFSIIILFFLFYIRLCDRCWCHSSESVQKCWVLDSVDFSIFLWIFAQFMINGMGLAAIYLLVYYYLTYQVSFSVLKPASKSIFYLRLMNWAGSSLKIYSKT